MKKNLHSIIFFYNLVWLKDMAMAGSVILLYDKKGQVLFAKKTDCSCLQDAHQYFLQLLADRHFAEYYKTASGYSILILDDINLQPGNTDTGRFNFLRNTVLYGLSRAEINVMCAKREVLRNNATAGTLFRSRDTVKSHLKSVYRKLGVNSFFEAMQKLDKIAGLLIFTLSGD